MSLSGLNQQYIPNTLDGLNVIEADQIYIDGQLVNLSDYVPYQGATRTINAGGQNIQTTHTATATNDVVNKGLLDTTISNLAISIAGTFLDKVTTTPQTVIGNVSYTAQLSADNLVVPETKEADLGGVVQVSGNYRRTESDAGVTATSSFGSITSSLGVYQATSTANFATLQLATVTVGKRYKVNINVLGEIASYTSSIQLYASTDGTSPTQSLGASAGFSPGSTIFQLLTGSFVPAYQYIILLCINSSPTGAGLTVKWFGLELYETGVELEKVTLPLLTASKVPILNSRKQLVSSGTDASKLDFLDNVSSDIQTQLNGKLNLSGNNANQNIVIGSYKVQSTATPTVNSDYTTKLYVDSEISGAGSLYLLKTGGTMTGDIVMGANKITSTATPTTDDTLTRKGYVDTQLALKADTSYVNTQLALKANLVGPNTFSNTHTFTSPVPITLSGLTASRVLQLNGSGNVESSTVTTTTLGYLDATSSVQNQLNSKLNLTGGTLSGDLTVNGTTTSVGSRFLGTPDSSPLGNFWIGLKGSGTEVQRLAIGINGNQTTGVVDFINIPKTVNMSSLTASRVVQLDASKNLTTSSVTTNELLTLSGVTSSVQTQLDGKVAKSGDTMTGQLTIGIAGGTDYLTYYNTNYTVNDYINQRFLFGNPSGINRSAYIQATLTTGDKTNILFYTQSGGVGERMRITGDGNVGIGTNAPGVKLHVVGNTSLDGQCNISGNNVLEFASALTKEVNAGKIGYGWVTANSLDIVGGGLTAGSRAVVCYDRLGVGIAPTESFQTSGNAIIAGTLTASSALLANQLTVYNETIDNDSRYVINSFRKGWSSFQVGSESSITYTLSSSGINGPHIMRMNTYVWPRGPKIQLDQNKTYQVEFNIRRLGTASTNTFYLAVQEYNWLGTNLAGDGVDWYYPINGVTGIAQNTLADGVWYNYKASVGPNGGKAHASTARYISVGFIVNYSSGTDLVEVSNLKIFPIEDDIKSQFKVSGNVGIGTTNPVTALHIARAFTTDTDYSGMISFENTQPGGYVEWQMGPHVIGGAGCFGIRGGTDGFSGLSNLLTIRAVSSTACRVGINRQAPEGDLHVQLTGAVDDFWGKLVVKTTSFWGDGCSTRSETAGTQYATMFPMMFLQPHVVSDSEGWCRIRMGRSGGVSTGRWWEVANRVDSFFQIGVEGSSQFIINPNGTVQIPGNLTAGSFVSQSTAGIGTASPTGVLDVFSTTADYTNSVVIRTPWSSVVLDNTQVAGGRKWSLLSGGTGAGVGVGGFGLYDITASAYRIGVSTSGTTTIYGETNLTGTPIVGSTRTPTYRLSLDNFSTTGRAIWAPLQHLPLYTTPFPSYINWASLSQSNIMNLPVACHIHVQGFVTFYTDTVGQRFAYARLRHQATGNFYYPEFTKFFNITGSHEMVSIDEFFYGMPAGAYDLLFIQGGNVFVDGNDRAMISITIFT